MGNRWTFLTWLARMKSIILANKVIERLQSGDNHLSPRYASKFASFPPVEPLMNAVDGIV